MTGIRFDPDKFKASIVQIIQTSSNKTDALGKIRLNKILYYSDMIHYIWKQAPLTGASYVRRPFGPVAEPLNDTLEELRRLDRIDVSKENIFGYPTWRFESRSNAYSNSLSTDQTALLDEVTLMALGISARALSDLSHGDAWLSVKTGEEIPYESAFRMIPEEPPSDEAIRRAKLELAKILEARNAT